MQQSKDDLWSMCAAVSSCHDNGRLGGREYTHRQLFCRPFCFQLEQTIKGRLVSGRMVSTKASVFARIRPHAEKGGHAARKAGEHPKNVDVKKLGKFDSEGIMMYGGTGEKHFDYMERVIQPQEDQVRTHQTTFHAFLLYRSQRTNPWVFPLCLTASLTATM